MLTIWGRSRFNGERSSVMGVSCQKTGWCMGLLISVGVGIYFFKVWGSGLTGEVKSFLLSMAPVSLTSVNREMLFFQKNKHHCNVNNRDGDVFSLSQHFLKRLCTLTIDSRSSSCKLRASIWKNTWPANVNKGIEMFYQTLSLQFLRSI